MLPVGMDIDRRQTPHRSVAADVSRLKPHPWPASKGTHWKRSDPAHAGCYKADEERAGTGASVGAGHDSSLSGALAQSPGQGAPGFAGRTVLQPGGVGGFGNWMSKSLGAGNSVKGCLSVDFMGKVEPRTRAL